MKYLIAIKIKSEYFCSYMIMRRISLLFALFYCSITFGQTVPIGQWQDHLSYKKIEHVSLANNKVYAASSSGLYSVDPSEGSINRLSTINGLADIKATAMSSASEQSPLYVGYQNGVIDVISSNSILQVVDIKRANIIGNKQVNHFNFYSDEICFISTGFGVLQYDIAKNEIQETFLIGENGAYVFVNATEVFNEKLWAATNNGIYYANLSNDLFDPSSWTKDTTVIRANARYDLIVTFDNGLLANAPGNSFRSDSLYRFDGTSWSQEFVESNESYRDIKAYDNKLIVANSTSVEVYENSFDNNIQRLFSINDGGILPESIAFTGANELWVGTTNNGLVKSTGPFSSEQFFIAGPVSEKAFNVKSINGNVYVTGGGHTTNWFTYKIGAELSIKKDDDWFNYDESSDTNFRSLQDLIEVAVDPRDENNLYAVCINNGILHIKDGEVVELFNIKNSPLSGAVDSLLFVSDIEFDAQGSLWIGNSEADYPLQVFANDDIWYVFEIKKNDKSISTGKITITSDGIVWIATQEDGIAVYDPGPRFGELEDDQLKFFISAAGSGNLPDNEVNVITEDLDGNIWVGTRAGLRVFFNGSGVFENGFNDAADILIEQDGQTQVLFENQLITDIAVDAANRKWFATLGNGVYLMSPDGTQEVFHFTEENSPLYSDFVQSVAVNEKTGEVYFATEKGLIGFRGTATEGASTLEDFYAFPNPVSRDYNGLIGITGLMSNSEVIITDVGGNLVTKLQSEGGTATWDMRNLNNSTVASGVYLIYAVDESGSEKGVTKLLIDR